MWASPENENIVFVVVYEHTFIVYFLVSPLVGLKKKKHRLFICLGLKCIIQIHLSLVKKQNSATVIAMNMSSCYYETTIILSTLWFREEIITADLYEESCWRVGLWKMSSCQTWICFSTPRGSWDIVAPQTWHPHDPLQTSCNGAVSSKGYDFIWTVVV